jgi:aspartate 1-decarboxylase
LEAADIYPNERVQILNRSNGSRVETYVIEGTPGSGVICMNGPAARWAQVGDTIIIISYGLVSEEEAASLKPRVVYVDRQNRIQKEKASHGKSDPPASR